MLKNGLHLFSLILLASFLTACATMRANSDYDRKIDFTAYKTWAWISEEAPKDQQGVPVKPWVDRYVRQQVEQQLKLKGLTLSTDTPDLLLGYQVARTDKLAIYSAYGGDTWSSGGGVEVYPYVQGTLALSFMRAADKGLIWRGWAAAEIDPEITPKNRDKKIAKAVKMIMKRYPPPVKAAKNEETK